MVEPARVVRARSCALSGAGRIIMSRTRPAGRGWRAPAPASGWSSRRGRRPPRRRAAAFYRASARAAGSAARQAAEVFFGIRGPNSICASNLRLVTRSAPSIPRRTREQAGAACLLPTGANLRQNRSQGYGKNYETRHACWAVAGASLRQSRRQQFGEDYETRHAGRQPAPVRRTASVIRKIPDAHPAAGLSFLPRSATCYSKITTPAR